MISYYELLGMVREGNIPNKIKLVLNCGEGIYVPEFDVDCSFLCYVLDDRDLETDDIRYYLSETLLENQMFEKNIFTIAKYKLGEIKWDEKESLSGTLTEKDKTVILARRTEKLKKVLNEVIDKINELGE